MCAESAEPEMKKSNVARRVDDETSRWVSGLDKSMAEKLAKTGLIARREFAAVEDFVTGYIVSRTDVGPETRRAWRQARD